MEDKKINYRKFGITAKKYMGDDKYSWAVFLDGAPKVTGLSKNEIKYYQDQIYHTNFVLKSEKNS